MMTPEQYKIVTKYVSELQNQLLLRDEEIHIEDEGPSQEGSNAHNRLYWELKECYIRFCENFAEMPAESQRESVVHELVHVILRDLCSSTAYLESLLGVSAYTIFRKLFNRDLEKATDHLAKAISPFFPLINWEEKEENCVHNCESNEDVGNVEAVENRGED